jgi:hypothetical protein
MSSIAHGAARPLSSLPAPAFVACPAGGLDAAFGLRHSPDPPYDPLTTMTT